MVEVGDNELFKHVLDADEEAFQEGLEPKTRGMRVVSLVMAKLGYVSFISAGNGTPEIVDRIHALHSSLYRPSDIAVGGIHGGVFMFRDVFARVDIPIIYGQVLLDPFTCTNLSKRQLEWLSLRTIERQMFIDQFIDIFDFAGGIGHLGQYSLPPKEALQIFWLAAFQLQAAAAALSVAFDSRGAIQSALIGAELSIKAGLAAAGATETQRRKHGHDLETAAKALGVAYSTLDIDRVLSTIRRLPAYVANRYSTTQPNRTETGHIVMGAQYIAGEVMRQVTGFTLRSTLTGHPKREYPST